MKTYARIQVDNLLKSIVLMLLLLTVLWSIASLVAFRDILLGRPILYVNVGLSLVVGWFFYHNRYHERFSFGPQGFEFRRGTYRSSRRWEAFDRVSLLHSGGGRFVVRLYAGPESTSGTIEIPASRLGLDPSAFRFEAMRLIAAARGQAGMPAAGAEGPGGDEDSPPDAEPAGGGGEEERR